MKIHGYTEEELRFTAVLYATRQDVIEHIQNNGKLPKEIALGGFPTAARVLFREGRTGCILTPTQQLVFNAILREKRLPGGGVILVPGAPPIFAIEANQKIEVCSPRKLSKR
jgi:hypothetical protein